MNPLTKRLEHLERLERERHPEPIAIIWPRDDEPPPAPRPGERVIILEWPR